MNLIRRFYGSLPIIRELRALRMSQDGTARAIVASLAPSCRQFINLSCADHRDRLLKEPRYADPRCLVRYGQQFFSQGDEDGMIAETLRRLGLDRGYFLEVGVGDGLENNTTALLVRGWRGCWVEGSETQVRAIQDQFAAPIQAGQLVVRREFVTVENIAGILSAAGVPSDLDLMSLDIDRNTYWIWEALGHLKPKVVVVEYNGQIPADLDWKVPYDADRVWSGGSYFGASLKAFERLGDRLGYHLVGCTLNGVNAFFVRKDLCGDLFLGPYTAENHYEPLRMFLLWRSGYSARFAE